MSAAPETEPGQPSAADQSFFRFTTTRPVAVTMVVLATVVFGLVGLRLLPVNLLPDIAYPTITVRTEYPGASPEDVEERLSERIQDQVSVVQGVRRVTSISRAEVSDVVLEFSWGTEMVFAISDIRERLDRVRLPEDADRPLVLRYDPTLDPVMTLGLTAEKIDPIELRRIAEEEIERELSKVEGVAAVKVRGGDEEEIRVTVDPAALSVFSIDASRVAARLAEENVNTAAGSIEEGKTEFLVRTLGEFQSLTEVEEVIVERRNNGVIRVRDVATVKRVPQDKEVISRVNGQPCVLIDVYKEASANIVSLAEGVRRTVLGTDGQRAYAAGLREKGGTGEATKPVGDRAAQRHHATMTNFLGWQVAQYGAQLTLLQDQSTFIETSIDEVRGSAVWGGLFAILVILLFLRRLSPTLILAVSIPISVAASFAPIYTSGISLNVMSLGGLALGVGMLVDNSIVVLESIFRAREEGHKLRAAAVLGVSRVASAVTASTLTTIAVFFPIVFVEGVAGQLFRDQSLTVVYSLLMSLLVALFVIPMLASRGAEDRTLETADSSFGRVTQRASAGVLRVGAVAVAACVRAASVVCRPVAAVFDRAYGVVERVYPRALRAALGLRWATLGIAGLLLLFATRQIGTLGNELLPEVSQGELYVDVFLPRDATVERTDAVVGPVERWIAALPEVERTFLAVGVDKQELNDSQEGEHSARILVSLEPTTDFAATEEVLREKIRRHLRSVPEKESFRFARPTLLSFATPLVVEVLGRDLRALRDASQRVEAALRRVPGLRDVRSTLQRGNPELVLRLDREKMSALGLDSDQVTSSLRNLVQGTVPTRFPERERKIDMRVAMDDADLSTVRNLLEVNVNPSGNPIIPLGAVAEVQRLEGPSEIRRIGNSRGAEVHATVIGFDLGSSQTRVEAAIDSVPVPSGIEIRLGGQKEDMARSLDSLAMALALAVFLVYVVMASQFESLVQPFMILCSLPLALVGVVFTLGAVGEPISVVVLLGAIVLAGIVVNNAIILVDQINRLVREGTPQLEAIVEGARRRLRPVLMTTLTTVLGLLPLTGWLQGVPVIGGSGEGLELRAPLAITVVSGLLSSTLLTLIVIPVVYSVVVRRPQPHVS